MNKKLSIGLNFIRVCACLMVFMLHATLFQPQMGIIISQSKNFWLYPSAWAGVWIFFITGGFLAGVSFDLGNYSFSIKSIIKYYKKRFIKTIMPTIVFIIMCYFLVYPEMITDIPKVLLLFLTGKYQGNPGVDGVSVTWYTSTLLFLYIIAPILCYIAERMKKRAEGLPIIIWVLLIIGGACSRYAAYRAGYVFNDIYTPWYFNIDLFFGGVLIASFPKMEIFNNKIIQITSVLLYIATIIINAWYSRKMAVEGTEYTKVICMYVFPTIYLIIVSFFIISYRMDNEDYIGLFDKLGLDRILKVLSSFMFEFYLFHSLVLHNMSGYILSLVDSTTVVGHCIFLILIAIITAFFSVLYHRIFAIKMK